MKRKHIIKKMFLYILIVLCLLGIGFICYEYLKPSEGVNMFLASDTDLVTLYDFNFNEVKEIPRGEEVITFTKEYKDNDQIYKKIAYNNNEYLVLDTSLVEDYSNVIQEKEKTIISPVTVYKDSSYKILGFLKSGKVEILGFDKLELGKVNMYKIKYNDTFGYVYSKYLSEDEKEKPKYYDVHKERKFSYELYGGYAKDLDYYPHEKANFKDNVMPDEVRALYLNASSIGNVHEYINLARKTSINAFVVDIYDGYMAYASSVANLYSPSAYETSVRTKEEFKSLIDELKNNGFYVIGRIVAFNNPHFAWDNKDEAISNSSGATDWVSAYSRLAWEYNVALALEAVEEFGINEIQYDYVRFPESSYSWSKDGYDFKNKYNESKAEAIQNFLIYAADKIHEANAYISADVFGESAYTYVTAYGQYFPAISNVVDVISAMPYPDHFNKYEFGFDVPVWTKPYDIINEWSKYASKRQQEIETPAKVRTWVQAYNTIHAPYIEYGASEVKKQIEALYDNGLNDGYITWNAASSIYKYKDISSALESYR